MAQSPAGPETGVPPAPEDLVVIGRLGAVHGIKGWLKVYSFTAPPDNLLGYRNIWMGPAAGPDGVRNHADWRPLRMLGGRRQGKILVVQLDGIETREQAQLLTGCDLAVARQALPVLESGDYYWYQLEGLAVVTTDGCRLGRVDHMLETGANDVLVVRGDAGSIDQRERLVPWIPDQVILDVALDAGEMRVDWDPEF